MQLWAAPATMQSSKVLFHLSGTLGANQKPPREKKAFLAAAHLLSNSMEKLSLEWTMGPRYLAECATLQPKSPLFLRSCLKPLAPQAQPGG